MNVRPSLALRLLFDLIQREESEKLVIAARLNLGKRPEDRRYRAIGTLPNGPIAYENTYDRHSGSNPFSPTCIDHCAVIGVTVDQNLESADTRERASVTCHHSFRRENGRTRIVRARPDRF